ncbi:hypothetical protein Terro_0525 [Terriglobus roseus DSM 18391]|uniref:Uncharacterized protein n=1 Tax=Terriglobus roseus (strain DSM 18391 / NRRL B-41598 / KBS 63) TaxID=926566 RepID=I3ZC98_TERRK|nr:hypothetical protein [Terriglobus roseus]AFL86866.1 hypothetical protein Terro_0525 [Terriglobus roseus DSM 18391]
MLSRNLYILAGTLVLFATISYVVAVTGLAHEPGAPSEASLWRTIGIVLLLIGLVVALLGVLQSMFEQADRRTPGGQAGVHREFERRRRAQMNPPEPPNSGRG